MQVGVGNYERFVNMSDIYEALGENLCNALPAFHTFTGCDFNPAFFRKGKKRSLSLLNHSLKFIDAFSRLARFTDCDSATIFSTLEEFVCCMYGIKNICDVNEARVEIFTKTYRCNDVEKMFRFNTTNFDGSRLPPCKSELKQHILRTAYIASIWSHAHLQLLTQLFPTDSGWEEVDDKFVCKWYEGEQLPTLVHEIILEPETNNNEGNRLLFFICQYEIIIIFTFYEIFCILK